LLIPVIATAIAYFVLRKRNESKLARLSDALLAMSIGWITIWITSSFIAYIQMPYQAIMAASYVIGLVVFGVYLYLRTR
jgi:hypothetical protein